MKCRAGFALKRHAGKVLKGQRYLHWMQPKWVAHNIHALL